MSEELLSIIVPVYNVAPYLDRAMRSLLNQTYHNIEIILVNDGSTDHSGEICERYARQDVRIKLIVQENQGLSAARRTGVDSATGAYIAFVDSDDYVDPDYFQKLMENRGHFDIVVAQWIREDGEQIRRSGDTFALGAYDAPEDMDFLFRHLVNVSYSGGTVNVRPGIAAYVWNKLFRAEIIKAVFREVTVDLSNAEDRPTTYCAVLKSKAILFTDICGYHYIIRRGSQAHAVSRNWRYLQAAVCDFYDVMRPIFDAHSQRNVLIPQLELRIAMELTKIPDKLGFGPEGGLQIKKHIFPFINMLEGKRIALYGAGKLGWEYMQQIRNWSSCQVVLWSDENWEEYARTGWEVSPPELLLDSVCDHVVLSFFWREEADINRKKLVNMGVEAGKILWRPPLDI